MFGLATIDLEGQPTGCLEQDGRLYPLNRVAAATGLAGLETNLIDLFHDWDDSFAALGNAAEMIGSIPCDSIAAGDAKRLTPLQWPRKVVCAGANYYDHIAEMGVTDLRKEAQRLFFFMKPPTTALVGPGETVRMPKATKMFDWEVELAAIIGKPAKDVAEADALSHVAAWSVAMDLSARDLNQAPETFYKLDWVAGKAQDTSCPLGPLLIPAAFVANPQDLALGLKVNGETKQEARTSGMIFGIAEQIAILSRIMTLEPGDVILTGTPAGVGFPKRTFLNVGDRVDAWVEGIGTLTVNVTAS